MSGDAIRPKLNGDRLASLQHLSEMSKKAKARHVGTGMDVGSMLLQCRHQVMLALIHGAEGCFQILGLGDPCHGGSEEYADSKRTTE